jgi:transcriptional regulator with XRE-family HTH domain
MVQVHLAVKMEGCIDTTHISRLEADRRTNPAVYTLFRICQALEVPMTDCVNIELPK